MRRIYFIGAVLILLILVASYVGWALTRQKPVSETPGTSTDFFARLFPFGNQAPGTSGLGSGSNQQPETGTQHPVAIPRLRKISSQPVAGGFAFKVGTTSAVAIRFVERATGHVYETPAEGTTVVRISNTTIPEILEADWIDRDHVLYRYLSDIERMQNFYVTLAPNKTEQSLIGKFLAPFDRMMLNAAGTSLITVTESDAGATVMLGKPDGSDTKTVFTSPLRSWVPLIAGSTLYVASAPASGIPGFLYKVVNGSLTRVIGDVVGMTALPSPTGRYILISGGGKNAISMSMLDTKTGTSYPSPITTLTEKCVWLTETTPTVVCGVPTTLPTGAYPDDWLLGRVSFADALWKIEPISNTSTLLATPEKDAGESVDVWQPRIDSTGNYLTFINKRDLSFWSFRLQEKTP